MTKQGKLIILSGPSGTGKSTVVFKAMEGRQDLCFSTSVTTRSPRSGEVDGREYFFIDQARFDEMVENGELLEHARYVSNSYGTPRPFVEAQLRKGMNVILDIEVQGARQVKEKMPEAVAIFMMPPSLAELRRRLEGRGTEKPEAIEARIARAREEIREADFYDYLILNQDVVAAIQTVNELVDEGRELGQLVNDFTWYLRNLLLIQSSDDMEEVLDMSAEHLASLKEEAQMVSPDTLIRYIRIFSELASQIKYAAQKRILLEIAVIKLCRPQMESDDKSLSQRIENLEEKLEKGEFTMAPARAGAALEAQVPPAGKPVLPKAVPEDITQIIRNWKSIISETGHLTQQYLNKAVPSLSNSGGLLLVFDDKNAYSYLNDNIADSMDQFVQALEQRTGKTTEVVLKLNESARRAEDVVPDLRELIHFDIEEEDS